MNTDETTTTSLLGMTVTMTKGEDGSVIVWVDTDNEPDGSDGGRKLRVWVNDGKVYDAAEGIVSVPTRCPHDNEAVDEASEDDGMLIYCLDCGEYL